MILYYFHWTNRIQQWKIKLIEFQSTHSVAIWMEYTEHNKPMSLSALVEDHNIEELIIKIN